MNILCKMQALIVVAFVLFSSASLFSEEEQVVKENLGSAINTSFDELLPIISADGKTLYFCRQGDTLNTGALRWKRDQDIWYSELKDDGTWTPAKNIGKPLNNFNPNGVLSVSPDGNSLLLFGVYNEKGTPEKGVSVSHRGISGWTKPKKLIIKNDYNLDRGAQYSISSDGKILFMSLTREDSKGKRDLYASFLQSGGVWGEPMNLGDDLNTKFEDGSPFLAPDGVTLYFSSEGHGGYGSSDIFYTTRLDDSWTKWSAPVNLGPDINTAKRDYHYRIPASGDYAYFVSEEYSFGGRDIFRIKLTDKLKPKPVVLVSGRVRNSKTGEPIEAKVFYEILPDGKEAGVARSEPLMGKYKIILPLGLKYGFRAEANGFISVNDYLDLSQYEQYAELIRDLELTPIEEGEKIRINNIFFDYAIADLKKESYPELERITKTLTQYPDMVFEISGHTDSIGAPAYNKTLSERRAGAVKMFFIKKGINPDRIISIGLGETRPIASNSTEEGRRLNRRVEFKIISK